MTRVSQHPTSVAHNVTIFGLVVGAMGVGVLWASGVEFPFFYPAAGIIILLAGGQVAKSSSDVAACFSAAAGRATLRHRAPPLVDLGRSTWSLAPLSSKSGGRYRRTRPFGMSGRSAR
jgi:hypothetical protein